MHFYCEKLYWRPETGTSGSLNDPLGTVKRTGLKINLGGVHPTCRLLALWTIDNEKKYTD